MRKILLLLLLLPALGWTREPGAQLPDGFNIFPSSNIWNTAVDNAPISSSNTLWMDITNGHTGHDLHAEFGSTYAGSWNGIPYNLINSATPNVTVTWATDYNYSDESDPIPEAGLPIPADAICESDPGPSNPPYWLDPNSDRHCILIDTDTHRLYETFASSRIYSDGVWQSSWTIRQLSIFDLNSNDLRTAGWTSADAAGLPIFPGLVNWYEVQSGTITHALRFTLALTHGPYLWPARHNADSGGTLNPPFGMRVRMKASVDISGFSPTVQTIFKCMKKYGMFLADNGGDWFVTGSPNENWNDTDLHDSFITVGLPYDVFEVVDESTWMIDSNSAAVSSTYCGDASCNGSETCSDCSVDCGACASSGGGTQFFGNFQPSGNWRAQ